jgi:Flp pilus assembly protein TadD
MVYGPPVLAVGTGNALRDQKDLEGAVKHWRKALELDPKRVQAHYDLGNALLDQEDLEGAVKHYRKALEIAPKFAMAHNNLGIVLRKQNDVHGAVKHYRKALELAPEYPDAHCNLGHLLRAQCHFAEALEHLEKGHQLGSQRPGWPYPSAQWVWQCRSLLQLQQRAELVAQGRAQPKSPAELVRLAHFSRQFRGPYTAACLYAAAFAAQPGLAEELATSHNTHAARAAAAAVAGQGLDTEKLIAADKAKLRRQALNWLRADLKLCTQALGSNPQGNKQGQQEPASPLQKLAGPIAEPGSQNWKRALDRLTTWPSDPALAGLREEKELAKLPAAEQAAWRQFWADVQPLRQQTAGRFTETQRTGKLSLQHKEQVHEVALQAGRLYVFDLESTAFNAFLRLEDARGKKLAENDDIEEGVIQNSRILFTPETSGTYRLVATAFQGQGVGAYVLRIREFAGKK